MGDVFISYKTEDRPRVSPLVRALQAEGFAVWWDQHIEPGAHWREAITEHLEAARCVIVVWTSESVRPSGRFVHDEASHAESRGVLLPVMLDPVQPPLGFGQRQAILLTGWRGDRDAAPFRTLVEATRAMIAGEPPPRPTAEPHVAAGVAARMDRRWVIGGAAGVALAGAAAVMVGRLPWRLPEGAPAGPTTVVVLPFRNLSGDTSRDYLCEGISEDLRDALARLGSIRVIGRASSEAFRARGADPAALAARLGAAFMLDGSVRAAGATLRVSAQLVEAHTGVERWAQAYDRTIDDVLAVQSGISSAVAEALSGRLPAAEADRVARQPTAVPAAYDALLRGRQIGALAGDEATYRQALREFDAAIAADPSFADAYGARASTLVALAGQLHSPAGMREGYDEAIATARKAASLAPDSAYAEAVLGYALLYGRLDVAGARAAYGRAMRNAPNDVRVLIGDGQLSAFVGETGRAAAELLRAGAVDALNPQVHKAQAVGFYLGRRYRDAVAAARRALALSPGMIYAHALAGYALLLLGDTAGALGELRAEPRDSFGLAGIAVALWRSGDTAGARAAFAALEAFGDTSAYQQAIVLAQWGRPAEALDRLARARKVGDAGVLMMAGDGLLDPVRAEPAFAAQVRELALMAAAG